MEQIHWPKNRLRNLLFSVNLAFFFVNCLNYNQASPACHISALKGRSAVVVSLVLVLVSVTPTFPLWQLLLLLSQVTKALLLGPCFLLSRAIWYDVYLKGKSVLYEEKNQKKNQQNQLRGDCDVILRAERAWCLGMCLKQQSWRTDSSPTGYCPSIGDSPLYVAGQNTVSAPAGLAGHSWSFCL